MRRMVIIFVLAIILVLARGVVFAQDRQESYHGDMTLKHRMSLVMPEPEKPLVGMLENYLPLWDSIPPEFRDKVLIPFPDYLAMAQALQGRRVTLAVLTEAALRNYQIRRILGKKLTRLIQRKVTVNQQGMIMLSFPLDL